MAEEPRKARVIKLPFAGQEIDYELRLHHPDIPRPIVVKRETIPVDPVNGTIRFGRGEGKADRKNDIDLKLAVGELAKHVQRPEFMERAIGKVENEKFQRSSPEHKATFSKAVAEGLMELVSRSHGELSHIGVYLDHSSKGTYHPEIGQSTIGKDPEPMVSLDLDRGASVIPGRTTRPEKGTYLSLFFRRVKR